MAPAGARDLPLGSKVLFEHAKGKQPLHATLVAIDRTVKPHAYCLEVGSATYRTRHAGLITLRSGFQPAFDDPQRSFVPPLSSVPTKDNGARTSAGYGGDDNLDSAREVPQRHSHNSLWEEEVKLVVAGTWDSFSASHGQQRRTVNTSNGQQRSTGQGPAEDYRVGERVLLEWPDSDVCPAEVVGVEQLRGRAVYTVRAPSGTLHRVGPEQLLEVGREFRGRAGGVHARVAAEWGADALRMALEGDNDDGGGSEGSGAAGRDAAGSPGDGGGEEEEEEEGPQPLKRAVACGPSGIVGARGGGVAEGKESGASGLKQSIWYRPARGMESSKRTQTPAWRPDAATVPTARVVEVLQAALGAVSSAARLQSAMQKELAKRGPRGGGGLPGLEAAGGVGGMGDDVTAVWARWLNPPKPTAITPEPVELALAGSSRELADPTGGRQERRRGSLGACFGGN